MLGGEISTSSIRGAGGDPRAGSIRGVGFQRGLVAESETADEREARRRHAGKSSGETYASTLRQLRPDAEITIVAPADDDAQVYEANALGLFDAAIR